MAIFCALCAQPGINLPDNWREYKDRYVLDIRTCWLVTYFCSRNLFMRGFMMDGNFQAEHMKMRNPENDIPLSNGTGFMVSEIPYEEHLKSVVERPKVRALSGALLKGSSFTFEQRSTCHDHWVVNNGNKHGGHLQSTGIGATACIHGNFVPNSVVDFQKGEA